MAIFTVISGKKNTAVDLARKINYIEDFCATEWDLIYGAGVSISNAYKEMMLTKNVFQQNAGKAYIHSVLSIEESEEIDVFTFKCLGVEICEMISTFGGNYQVLMAVHTNTDNLHLHYLVNNIDYLTGMRTNLDRDFLQRLKIAINEVLIRYDLSAIRMNGNFYSS